MSEKNQGMSQKMSQKFQGMTQKMSQKFVALGNSNLFKCIPFVIYLVIYVLNVLLSLKKRSVLSFLYQLIKGGFVTNIFYFLCKYEFKIVSWILITFFIISVLIRLIFFIVSLFSGKGCTGEGCDNDTTKTITSTLTSMYSVKKRMLDNLNSEYERAKKRGDLTMMKEIENDIYLVNVEM